jgi:transposase
VSNCVVPDGSSSTLGVSPCDCLAHQLGNAADQPDRVRRYNSDLTDAEWVIVRPLLPVPAWMNGRGGRPEGYCHRQMIDAVRYLVAEGVRWASLPADYPKWRAVYRFFRRWRDNDFIKELYGRLRKRLRELAGKKDATPHPASAELPPAVDLANTHGQPCSWRHRPHPDGMSGRRPAQCCAGQLSASP